MTPAHSPPLRSFVGQHRRNLAHKFQSYRLQNQQITPRSNRRKTIAIELRQRATETVNEYRTSRLASLRSDLETRLIKAGVAHRLQETRLAKVKMTRRLQESLRAKKAEQRHTLRTQQCSIVTRLKDYRSATRLKEFRHVSIRRKEANPRHKKGFDTTACFPLQDSYQAPPLPTPGPPTA